MKKNLHSNYAKGGSRMWSKQKVEVTGWQCFLRNSNRLYNSTIFFTNLCYFFGREKMSSPKINMFVSPLVPLSRGANGCWILLRAID